MDYGAVLSEPAGYADLQHSRRVHTYDQYGDALCIYFYFIMQARGNGRNDLQAKTGVAGYYARSSCGFDAFQAAGIGNNYTFHIFDYVSADFDFYVLRPCAEHIPHPGCTESDGCGLGTAGRHEQLLFQNGRICGFFKFTKHDTLRDR